MTGQSNLIAVRGFKNIVDEIIQLGGNFDRIFSPVVFEINVTVGSYLVLGRIFKMNSRALFDRAVGIVHRTCKNIGRNVAHLLTEAIPVFCQGKLGKSRHARLDCAENFVRGRRPCRQGIGIVSVLIYRSCHKAVYPYSRTDFILCRSGNRQQRNNQYQQSRNRRNRSFDYASFHNTVPFDFITKSV